MLCISGPVQTVAETMFSPALFVFRWYIYMEEKWLKTGRKNVFFLTKGSCNPHKSTIHYLQGPGISSKITGCSHLLSLRAFKKKKKDGVPNRDRGLQCNDLSSQSDVLSNEWSNDQMQVFPFNQKLQNETVCSQLKTTPRWLYHTGK